MMGYATVSPNRQRAGASLYVGREWRFSGLLSATLNKRLLNDDRLRVGHSQSRSEPSKARLVVRWSEDRFRRSVWTHDIGPRSLYRRISICQHRTLWTRSPVVVSFTERDPNAIRIISARLASKPERQSY